MASDLLTSKCECFRSSKAEDAVSNQTANRAAGIGRWIYALGFGVVLATALPGCMAHARGELVYDQPVTYVDAPPQRLETYPTTYYRGQPAYLVDGRWYYHSDRRWVIFREEPRELYQYRVRSGPPRYRDVPYGQYRAAQTRGDGRGEHYRDARRAAAERDERRRIEDRRSDARRRAEARQREDRRAAQRRDDARREKVSRAEQRRDQERRVAQQRDRQRADRQRADQRRDEERRAAERRAEASRVEDRRADDRRKDRSNRVAERRNQTQDARKRDRNRSDDSDRRYRKD